MSRRRKIIIIIYVIFLFGFLWFDVVADYRYYIDNKQKYEVCQVEITNVEYRDRGRIWAEFEYNQQSGKVPCNFWEREGDIIEVAYNADYEFIRTVMCINFMDVAYGILFVLGIIVIIRNCFIPTN